MPLIGMVLLPRMVNFGCQRSFDPTCDGFGMPRGVQPAASDKVAGGERDRECAALLLSVADVSKAPTAKAVCAARDRMTPRGPDGAEYRGLQGPGGVLAQFGHRGPAVLDHCAAGAQPMRAASDRSIWHWPPAISYLPLRRALRDLGYGEALDPEALARYMMLGYVPAPPSC